MHPANATFLGVLHSELTEHQMGLIFAAALGCVMALLSRRWLRVEARPSARRTAFLAGLYVADMVLGALLQAYVPAIRPYHDVLPSLLLGAAVVSALSLLVFDLAFARLKSGAGVAQVVRDLVQVAVFLIVVIIILHMNGVNPLSLLTTSVVFSAIIGFALQDTIGNYFAGVALQIEKTIAVGDWIESEGKVGRIHAIRLRATSMVTKDGDLIALPNNLYLKGHLKNLSRPSGSHRMWIKVAIGYEHPPRDVKNVLIAALDGVEGVATSPTRDCVLVDFGDHGIIYAVRYWIDDVAQDTSIDSEVRSAIWYALRDAGIAYSPPSLLAAAAVRAADKQHR